MPDTQLSEYTTADLPNLGSAVESSRHSARGAGWECTEIGSFVSLVPKDRKRMSWFNPKMLWRSRNDVLAHLVDPAPAERAQWVAGLSDADLTVDLSARLDEFSFLVMGDTGEGDYSQYALVPPLLAQAASTEFLFICSDVLYPVGDVNDYASKFYTPYSKFEGPIYAIPGNHDWYDDLYAFMYHLCGRTKDPSPPAFVDGATPTMRRRAELMIRRRLWRKPTPPDDDALQKMAGLRELSRQKQPVRQPGPYFVIDTAQLRLVCIDTGILGDIDSQQGQWLLRVSADPRPKILFTGKPLLVDGRCDPCAIAGASGRHQTVLDIVHDPQFNYVASIGGDIHNYQRYPVRLGDRTIQHVVAGGGGAFMHATHLIQRIDPEKVCGVTEDEFRCYPLRRDSLAAYSRVLQAILRRAHVPVDVEISSDQAALFLARKRGIAPLATRPIITDSDDVSTAKQGLRAQAVAYSLLTLGGKRFHKWFSPFYDWDTPPFYKSFLRIDVGAGSARVTCRGVTGCKETENDPPVEDQFELTW
ncbi:metallophosphoesterase [Jatrophihabitans sp.]|jgi:hypothetical protein|uniref:metallophosphoesterase n=1 Tax=Jatrophihabitans sp. TaxID=1932789 RepID=UPI002EE42DD5